MGSNVRINRVREILRATPDGMTIAQLAELAGTHTSHVHRMIHKFPDAYIDRWLKKGQRCTAVWCVVVPPENCPRPTIRKK
jgi:hypothetical protein